jgi:hypothetical protein
MDPVGVMEVDFATSFTWHNSEYRIGVEAAFEETQRPLAARDVRLPGFTPSYMLLDVILHFFREAYFEEPIMAGKDVPLGAFLDILMLYRRHQACFEGGRFGSFARNIGAEAPCAWVLTHLDRVFETELTVDLGVAGVASEGFLNSWRKSGGMIRNWRGTMRERMSAGAAERLRMFMDS